MSAIFRSIASRVVSHESQEAFATLSGDRNPMHMDKVAARRTQAGSPVVHGVHSLLWALETLAAQGHPLSSLSHLKVRLSKWVYLGDESVLSVSLGGKATSELIKIEVLGMTVLSAEFIYGAETDSPAKGNLSESPAVPLAGALDLSFAELQDRTGDAFTAAEKDSQTLFPNLSSTIGATAVSEIAACSYIVGMEAPGLHSMFSKLDLSLTKSKEPCLPRAALHYQVAQVDERFRKARISVAGRSIAGHLDVFIRVPPVQQATMETISANIDPLEFDGMHALILGGSRGLGEVTAKLIAAGGGSSTITYAVGKAEADRVADQILAWGGDINTLPYDVRLAPQSQLPAGDKPFTHLFYFATNPIFRPKADLVSPPLLAEFTLFYLQGFHDLCSALTHLSELSPPARRKLTAYYPSSVYVAERPAGMTEYAMIKSAGEQMCHDMNQYLPNLQIITTRLPRLPTDQTTGVLPERELDPKEILLPIVREMYRLSNSP
jgi:acyl dehydratase